MVILKKNKNKIYCSLTFQAIGNLLMININFTNFAKI